MTTSQIQSGGNSTAEIHDAALAAAKPERGLSWLDIGCGRGTCYVRFATAMTRVG
jgi:ubiquinone/menaquinone biosynthesis C-methylase UbiE